MIWRAGGGGEGGGGGGGVGCRDMQKEKNHRVASVLSAVLHLYVMDAHARGQEEALCAWRIQVSAHAVGFAYKVRVLMRQGEDHIAHLLS